MVLRTTGALLLLALAIAGACARGVTLEEDGSGTDAGTPLDAPPADVDLEGGDDVDPSLDAPPDEEPDLTPPCPEDPCKLVNPQCGCDEGKMCVVNSAGDRYCANAGQVATGDACGAGKACAPGNICIRKKNSPLTSTCMEYCDDDGPCDAPGGLCAVKLSDNNGGSVPGVAMCSENCDPLTSAGCPVSGTACRLGQEDGGLQRWYSICTGAGSGTQDAPCTDSEGCAPGFVCVTSGYCVKWCELYGAPCPGALFCYPITGDPTLGGVTYGLCDW